MMHITLMGKHESDAAVLDRNLGYICKVLASRKLKINEITEHVILEANDLWPRRAMTRVTSVKATEN